MAWRRHSIIITYIFPKALGLCHSDSVRGAMLVLMERWKQRVDLLTLMTFPRFRMGGARYKELG